MKKIPIILLSLTLSSCQLYNVVVLDKVTPKTVYPYPIRDTTSIATKILFLNNQNVMWVRDKFNDIDYEIGDTIICYFK